MNHAVIPEYAVYTFDFKLLQNVFYIFVVLWRFILFIEL